MFAGLNPGERAAYGLVQNMLRTAHNTAVARTAPARVVIDRELGEVRAEGMLVAGTWHFETPEISGAFGIDGVVLNVAEEGLIDDGFQGRALSFDGEAIGARAEMPIQNDPIFDFRLGFAIDLAVRLESFAAAKLLDVGGSITCEVTGLGGIKAAFFGESTDRMGKPTRGARIEVETPPGVLRPGRWTRLRIVYDRNALRVLADMVEVALREESPPVWQPGGALVLGGGRTPFPGAIDNLVVAVVTGEERATLPEGVRFAEGTPREIFFAPGGALDPARHAAPVLVGLELESGRTETIQVNLYGTIE